MSRPRIGGLSFAASALVHLAIILALLPQRCSLPAVTPPISVDLVRQDDLPPDQPAPLAQDDPPQQAQVEDQPPQDTAGRAGAPEALKAGWISPFSVGQSPQANATMPSDIDKPAPPAGGDATTPDGSGQARSGLPFQVLSSRGDGETDVPAPVEPSPDPDAGQRGEGEPQPLSEETVMQRLTDYGAMLNGRMRWQLTGKLPGVTPFTIVVTIELDGTISSATVTQSTGVPDVDLQALQRILALSPLPPPPIRLENLQLQGRAFPQQ